MGGPSSSTPGAMSRSGSSEALVDIIDPWGHRVARVPLGVGALATSSTTRRRWKIPGGEAHHLIDPRTLAPAVSPIISATAIAATAVEAGAKVMLLHGSDGLVWAAAQPWIKGALAIWAEGSVYATNGWRLVAA
ncbi:MAG: FAD:protein FMN transferase [Acidimicrobiia bacterium]|nr:FAD:protein FMN transferase [Acidimicrobiia bacterium]